MDLQSVLAQLESKPEEEIREIATQVMEQTRGRKFVPSPGPQTEAWFCDADVLLYGGEAGGGKALALDTPILTRDRGWSTMGDMRVGDVVFASDGSPTTVVAVSEIQRNPCFEVELSTGEVFVADEGHQWLTLTKNERQSNAKRTDEFRDRRRENRESRATKDTNQSKATALANAAREYVLLKPIPPQSRTTKEIAESLTSCDRANHSIEVAGALQYDAKGLRIDPYLLGLWLGDGTAKSGEVGMTEADFDAILPAVVDGIVSDKKLADRDFRTVRFEGLQKRLRGMGLLRNKHIPGAYKTASVEQRLALLQGLMDTDGTCDKRGQCEIALSDKVLADDVLELIRSLGIKAYQREKPTTSKTSHRMKFVTDLLVFRLERKAVRQVRGGARSKLRYITRCDPVPIVDTICIEVDSPDHSYLAGECLIPTHNSGLICGLALENHHQSLIMRRNGVDLEGGGGIIEDLLRINGSRNGYSGKPPPTLRTEDGRIITFGSATNIGDEQKYQGRARDLLAVDEATQFAETQIRFLMGWVRTVQEGQRTRTVLATNPPLSSVGDWVIGMFRPWLDTTHPKPAQHGELRWYVTVRDAAGTVDLEVDGPDPVEVNGDKLIPTSRTFIPARLADNPFIQTDDYQKQLDALPEPYRSAARDGNFMASRVDNAFQVIPTQWIREAQDRWTAEPPPHTPMCALSADIAQGGNDTTTLVARYDYWIGLPEQTPGRDTPTGNEVAGLLISKRRNGCVLIIDMGGGYGGATKMRLKDNEIDVVGFKGAETSSRRTNDQAFTFYNNRAEVYWRLREALDPSQDGGAVLALPDDPELVSELTTPEFKITPRGIQITPKEKVVEILGHSPDKADAVVMANFAGPKLQTHGNMWRKFSAEQGHGGRRAIKVNQSHSAARRKR